jgi:urea transport system substrate-binding protein
VPFFKEVAAAGLTPADCPVVSFSLAEDELRALPTKDLVGELGCWTYFMSLTTPENKAFLKRWDGWLKTEKHSGVVKEKRAVDSPMVLSYDGVYLWKAAVEKAGTFDVDTITRPKMFTSAKPKRTDNSKYSKRPTRSSESRSC